MQKSQKTDRFTDLRARFIDLEWQQRNRLLEGTQPPADPASPPSKWSRLSENAAITARNRYFNVEPFAQNRVKLKVADGVNDYINASPIQLGKRKYIATQGPKDSNVNHFYRMVAAESHNPAVVVMLTQTHEAGKEKCFQYYPLSEQESPLIIPPDNEIGDGFQGQVELISITEEAKSKCQVRKLRMTASADGMESLEKDVYHLLFAVWPDFLIPEGEDRVALIDLVHLSASLNTGDSKDSLNPADLAQTDQANPRIVHCSAGVGRSGTFIALDSLLNQLHRGELDQLPADEDPIADTVDLLRQQRMMMVQGESQFNFLYEILREQFQKRVAHSIERAASTDD